MKNVIVSGIIFLGLIISAGAQVQDMALHLDGIDDYVEVPDAASLDLSGPMTISLWYYYS
jgi:hypothetical protein